MSGSDVNNGVVQAFREPETGATVTVTTVAAASAKTAAAIATSGWYQVHIPTGAGVLRFATGAFATATATAADRPREPGIDHTFLAAGDTMAIYDPGAGGTVVSLTLMPD